MGNHREHRRHVDILIAEDSATQAQRLQHILEQQGYRVIAAANGRLALEAALGASRRSSSATWSCRR